MMNAENPNSIKPTEANEALTLKRLELLIEFAKFGFRGTLSAGILGILLLMCFAGLQASGKFQMETYGYVMIALIVVVGTVSFGFLSLYQLPNVAARFFKIAELSLTAETKSDKDPTRQPQTGRPA